MSLTILRPGLLTTVQDLGRYGYQRIGVMVSGAMDSFAHRMANLLVGNEQGEATLEITLIGPVIRFEKDALIAICGADFSPSMEGIPVPTWRPVWVRKGSILKFSPSEVGARAYLAIAGGYAIDPVMNSRSTFLRAGIGGFQGRALKAGDVLNFRSSSNWFDSGVQNDLPFTYSAWRISKNLLPLYRKNPTIRVMEGGEYEWFTREAQANFFSAPFTVSSQSDRMGYRLTGPKMAVHEQRELISEAVTMGTVQISSDGNPIVLMADRATTGGYPKLAHIATVDLPLLAQVRPGEQLWFYKITLQEAQRLWIRREREIQQLIQGINFYLRLDKTRHSQ
ncbi:biotin-dependent carboxyltransferase family protein [Ammoniphilus resinae]|uniref:Antagonist of KipI n=1 Tax=Ammoniphilus resinae TaxID=861532 RepID=A0ABS4GUG7_9BACL|nr:biotin-dependent carboxyltransferase family protein [Ammoniphilus resinae]MBP1933697.1 antagonist of KipI [Ammoniphilus resinae]